MTTSVTERHTQSALKLLRGGQGREVDLVQWMGSVNTLKTQPIVSSERVAIEVHVRVVIIC